MISAGTGSEKVFADPHTKVKAHGHVTRKTMSAAQIKTALAKLLRRLHI